MRFAYPLVFALDAARKMGSAIFSGDTHVLASFLRLIPAKKKLAGSAVLFVIGMVAALAKPSEMGMCDFLYKRRLYFSAALLLFLVLFQLHGSSIANWRAIINGIESNRVVSSFMRKLVCSP